MLTHSCFMIIRVMVLLRRIRERTAGGPAGSRRNTATVYPRLALPRKWPRVVAKRKTVGGGGWGTRRKRGALSDGSSVQVRSSAARALSTHGVKDYRQPRTAVARVWEVGRPARALSEAAQVQHEAHTGRPGTHTTIPDDRHTAPGLGRQEGAIGTVALEAVGPGPSAPAKPCHSGMQARDCQSSTFFQEKQERTDFVF